MQHFPIFLNTTGRQIVIVGGGDAALAKLRLLKKSEARIFVIANKVDAQIAQFADEVQVRVQLRDLKDADIAKADLIYAATEDDAQDADIARRARQLGTLVNVVDNLELSEFITPAIVDRSPVTIAIGTEGAAPVLARAIKKDLEDRLPANLGLLSQIGKRARHAVEVLPFGKTRRDFWTKFYFSAGPRAFADAGAAGAKASLNTLIDEFTNKVPVGHVDLAGAGPGDPELLTLKVRKALDEADVVIHDRLVAPEILELVRREATIIEVGKTGFGSSTPQSEIDQLIVDHASRGSHVVRLKSGDPTVFGRLDEEIDAITEANISFAVHPGVTAASAAAATLKQSLTKRDRNSSVRFLTGHDINGFVDHDWRVLARPGEVAAIYMGKRAARYLQGRLLMHSADPQTPISVVENVSRPDQLILSSTLGTLTRDLEDAALIGPAVIMFGLAPRATEITLPQIQEELA